MTGEYWVFKYVEDLARQEPRNIGILFRAGEAILAKFLGERDAGGALDLRTVRGVVRHTGSYRQWVDYWRYCLKEAESVEDAVRRVTASGKGNYIISEGSTVVLPDVNLNQAASQLFHSLVTEFPTPRVEELSLAARVDEIIRAYRLRDSPFFQDSPIVACPLEQGVVEHVRPSYGWVNGHSVYFQKVSLSPYRLEPTQKDVHNAAWIFEKLRAARQDVETKALIKIIESEDFEPEAQRQTDEYLTLLGRLSTEVINVDDDRQVEAAFRPLVTM